MLRTWQVVGVVAIAGALACPTLAGAAAPAAYGIDDVSVTEGDSGTASAVFTVTRSGHTNNSGSIDYATSAGSAVAGADYVAASGTLQFARGVTTRTISVPIVGDNAVESDETFTVVLSQTSHKRIVVADTGTATITNDDVQQHTVSVFAAPDATAGTVSISGAGCSGTSCTVDEGTTVTISAAANSNWRFSGWSGCVTSTATSTTVTVNAATSCVAHFYALWAVSAGRSNVDRGFAAVALEDGTLAVDGLSQRTLGENQGVLLRLDVVDGTPVSPDLLLLD
jgi:hypothetical protein